MDAQRPVDGKKYSEPPAIFERRDGFFVLKRNDGIDYWQIYERFRRNISQTKTMIAKKRGKTSRYTEMGKTYVVKEFTMGTPFPNCRLAGRMGLSANIAIMRKVNAAVDAGCRVTQDFFMVAEKNISLFRKQVVLILEYLEGHTPVDEDEFKRYEGMTGRVFTELHRHRLTLSDFSLGNFIVDGTSLRVIDLSCRFPFFLNKVKDCIKLRELYGIKIEISGWFDRLIQAALILRNKVRDHG